MQAEFWLFHNPLQNQPVTNRKKQVANNLRSGVPANDILLGWITSQYLEKRQNEIW